MLIHYWRSLLSLWYLVTLSLSKLLGVKLGGTRLIFHCWALDSNSIQLCWFVISLFLTWLPLLGLRTPGIFLSLAKDCVYVSLISWLTSLVFIKNKKSIYTFKNFNWHISLCLNSFLISYYHISTRITIKILLYKSK